MPRAQSPHLPEAWWQAEVPLVEKTIRKHVGLDGHRVRLGLQGAIVTALAAADAISCGGGVPLAA